MGDAGSSEGKASGTGVRIRQLLAEMEPVLPGEVENATALELLRWWAESEPVAAIDFAVIYPNVHGRPTLVVELFVAWLNRTSDEALPWLHRLEAGPVRAQILPSVISMVAQQEPREALRLAGELSGEPRRAALSALFLQWTASRPVEAVDQAARLTDARERNLVLRQVLGKWMDTDLNAALAWAKNLPPGPAPDSFEVLPPMVGIVMEKWASMAPADAAGYLLTTPEGAGRIGLLKTVAAQWAGAHPREALQWTASIANDADRGVMMRGVLATVAQTDVRAAAELALTISRPEVAIEGLTLVIDQWNARDAAGLAGWTTTLAARGDVRTALGPVVTTWAAVSVSSVEQWLTRLPAGEARDASCAALSQYLAPRDARRAAQWADAISNPALRRERNSALGR